MPFISISKSKWFAQKLTSIWRRKCAQHGANAAQKMFEREEFLLSTHQPRSMPYSTAEIVERYGTGTRWLPRIWSLFLNTWPPSTTKG
jgi:hypothetical protein